MACWYRQLIFNFPHVHEHDCLQVWLLSDMCFLLFQLAIWFQLVIWFYSICHSVLHLHLFNVSSWWLWGGWNAGIWCFYFLGAEVMYFFLEVLESSFCASFGVSCLVSFSFPSTLLSIWNGSFDCSCVPNLW